MQPNFDFLVEFACLPLLGAWISAWMECTGSAPADEIGIPAVKDSCSATLFPALLTLSEPRDLPTQGPTFYETQILLQ